MANKTPIARWLLSNRASLTPSFKQLEWPSRYFPGAFDFSATISVNAIEVTGRGIDFDKELALEKAAAECVERFICKRLNIDSVGLAVSGESGAAEHAKREALERYFFQEHIRRQIPLVTINADSAGFSSYRETLIEFQKYNGGAGDLEMYKMATSPHAFGCVAVISTNRPSFVGLALHSDAPKAALHAFLEAMANFARFRDAPNTFEQERKSNPDLWNCDPEYISTIVALCKSVEPEVQPIQLPQLISVPLDILRIEELHECPITPVKFAIQECK